MSATCCGNVETCFWGIYMYLHVIQTMLSVNQHKHEDFPTILHQIKGGIQQGNVVRGADTYFFRRLAFELP